jgi:hypothetical protein
MTKLKAKASTKGSVTKASASRTSASKRSAVPAANDAALIVLGFNDRQKPCGARFEQDKPNLVSKAAELMGFKVYSASHPEVAALAQKLPVGRLYANGRGFVPNVRQSLYSDLIVALASKPQALVSNGGQNDALPPARGLPQSWDEIGPGHLVIAHESLEYGWWEAIVVDRKDDVFTLRYRDYPSLPKFFRHRSGIALMCPQAADASGLSRTWDELRPGQLVIAHESPANGWWEAIVVERKDDAFTLQFRDYTDLPHFVRHRSGIALMASPTEETQPARPPQQA